MAKTQQQGQADAEPKETTVEFLASLAVVLVTGLFIITFVLQAFEIPSSSMEDTLLIGDHLFVNREQFAPPTKWMGPLLPYRQIQRGDIICLSFTSGSWSSPCKACRRSSGRQDPLARRRRLS